MRDRQMTERAQQIWKAFCEELTQEPTDDMREALATAIRKSVRSVLPDELERKGFTSWKQELLKIADELEEIELD